MLLLMILGIVIWVAAHLFARVAQEWRAALTERMGEGSKGVFALILVLSVVLMVIGYRAAPVIPVYPAFPGGGYVNNLLMLVAILMFGVGSKGSWLAARMRHPMLTAMKIWALAHLIVNGDLASIILFASMLGWAVAEVIVINKQESWTKDRSVAFGSRDIKLIIGWLIAYAVIAYVHVWLGHNPFLGSY